MFLLVYMLRLWNRSVLSEVVELVAASSMVLEANESIESIESIESNDGLALQAC